MAQRKKKVHSRLMTFWSVLLALGSLAGLIALPYTIVQMWRDMPAIQFEGTGVAHGSHLENGVTVVEKNFNGKLKNLSHAPTSVTSISLVVFNKERNAYLRDGFTGEKIFEFSTPGDGNEITLPIQLNPKETKKLNIVSFISLQGEDERLYPESYPKLTDTGFVDAKYQYELLFEDVNGNYFDMQGNLMNKKLLELKWIYQNEKWYSPVPILNMTVARIGFRMKTIAAF